MGILNVTPDSFSDGGRYDSVAAALERARVLAAEGADIVDVGGESTRPGAAAVSLQQELDRVVSVIEGIAREIDVTVSVDTSRADVMREAAGVGAAMINDVRALQAEGALQAAAAAGLPVCLMHMQGEPATMQDAPAYDDVVTEVAQFLSDRRTACLAAGVRAEHVFVDPGFGFGKTLAHNVTLLRGLKRLTRIAPVLVGLSRKGMIGALTGDASADRSHGSVAAAILAVQRGAALVRVHDVGPTVRALRLRHAIEIDSDQTSW